MNGSTALMVIAVAIGATFPSLITALFAGTHCYTQYCITSFGRIGRPDLICDILLDGGFVIIGGATVLVQVTDTHPALIGATKVHRIDEPSFHR